MDCVVDSLIRSGLNVPFRAANSDDFCHFPPASMKDVRPPGLGGQRSNYSTHDAKLEIPNLLNFPSLNNSLTVFRVSSYGVVRSGP